MSKVTVENYFEISELLSKTELEDFAKYRKEAHSKNYQFNKENKLQELVHFFEQKQENNRSHIFANLSMFNFFLSIIIFIITIIIVYVGFDTIINVNKFLIFTVLLPFIYMMIMMYQIKFYKFPLKEEYSFFSYLLSLNKNYNPTHSHIIKTYSMHSFIKFGLVYTLGILFSIVIIFTISDITFSFTSTFKMNDWVLDKMQYLSSPNDWAWFLVALVAVFVLIPKTILLFYSAKNISKSIEISLKEQAKDFYNEIYKSVDIKKVEEIKTIIEEIITTDAVDENIIQEVEIVQKSYKDYYIIYYQIELEQKDKILFDASSDGDLFHKTFEEYSFGLFAQEDEDDIVLETIGNLVVLFSSPESLPDETFKDDIKGMLEIENIHQIWVVPLVKDGDNNYRISQKGDDKYDEWHKQINTILFNDKVRLYNEK